MRSTLVALFVVLLSACAAYDDPGAAPPAGPPIETTAPPGPPVPTTGPEAPEPPDTSPATTEPTTPATEPTTPEPTMPGPDPLQSLAYESVAGLQFPIALHARPGDAVALLAQRNGIIRLLSGDEVGDVVGDLRSRTSTDGERGLLGLARHPGDDSRLFVHYTDRAGDTVVSEMAFDGSEIEAGSERVILTVDQPARNHNGGMVQFGPDGFLYLGLGDGGGAGDRFGHGQDTGTLLGGLVRVDVDEGTAELWQYGLRNPWRFWIDGDDLWMADVGQNAWEEINLASLGEQGVNHGWPIMEAGQCYAEPDCEQDGLTMPLVETAHGDAGTCSVTGGVVYRGAAIPELDGRFLYSDYCGGYLRSVDSGGEVDDHTGEVGVPGPVVSFGVDGDGEVYVLTTTEVLRLVAER